MNEIDAHGRVVRLLDSEISSIIDEDDTPADGDALPLMREEEGGGREAGQDGKKRQRLHGDGGQSVAERDCKTQKTVDPAGERAAGTRTRRGLCDFGGTLSEVFTADALHELQAFASRAESGSPAGAEQAEAAGHTGARQGGVEDAVVVEMMLY